MQALVFEQFGGPEVLRMRELRDPVPAADEVLVRTRAIGLNFADIYRRQVTIISLEIRHGLPATKPRARWWAQRPRPDSCAAIASPSRTARFPTPNLSQCLRID